MAKYNIMYIANESSFTGASQSLIDMLKSISDNVKPVVIIPWTGIIENWFRACDIRYYVIPFTLSYGEIGKYDKNDEESNFVDNYNAALQLLPIIKQENIQLIHSNSSVINVGAIAALMAHIPHVWHVRELVKEQFGCELFDWELKSKLMKQANAIITISEFVRTRFYEKYGIQSVKIYDGMDHSRFISTIDKTNADNSSFLLPGVISEGKGQWEAVRAVEFLVQNRIKNVQLYIVGDGVFKYVWEMKVYIKKNGLEDNIHIYPFQKDLSLFRDKCSFAITSSKNEALGRVTLEAMLAANIVIGANTGGTLEIIGQDQERGYLYQQGNYVELANTMESAMQASEDGRAELRRKAQEYVLNEFDIEKYGAKIINIYETVITGNLSHNTESEDLLKEIKERYENYNLSVKEEKPTARTDREKKYWNMFLISNRWLTICQNGESLAEYFLQRNLLNVAIYGIGYFGRSLYYELINSGISVSYAIDRRPKGYEKIIDVQQVENGLKPVDAIIVTVTEEEWAVKEYLESVCEYRIICLSEILNTFEV